MSRSLRFTGGAALALHLLFVVFASLQDMAVILPSGINRWIRTKKSFSAGEPWRRIVAAYFDCTGIEAGYSFFAPSVPGNAKLAFELQYADDQPDYDVPVVNGATAGDRVSALLDHLRFIRYRPLREALLRSLVDAVVREHRDAIMVRAVLGTAELTTPADYRAAKRISYQPLFAYDFHYAQKRRPPLQP